MLVKKCFFVLLAAIALGACSDNDGETADGAVVLDKSTPTTQVIYADETQKNEGIKFTATEPWTAIVNEVQTKAGGSNVEWLTLSAYSGGAGEFTLSMTLTTNTTGRSRKAEIRIMAGDTMLSVTVEQKAETESGEQPVASIPLVKTFTYRGVFNSDRVHSSSEDYILEESRTFDYDAQGRVIRIASGADRYGSTIVQTYDYATAGKVNVKLVETYKGGSLGQPMQDEYNIVAALNQKGFVASLADDDKNIGKLTEYIRFSYTDDGRLAKWEDTDAGDEGASGTFTYTGDGRLAKYEYANGKYESDGWTSTLDLDKAYAKRYPNNLSIDVVGLLLNDDDDYNFVFYAGLAGKTSDFLPELMTPDFINYDDWVTRMMVYPEPGVTIEESYYSIEWSDEPLAMNYTFDKDDRLTKIETKRDFSVMKTTYTVVVSNEYLNPDVPEMGYKYEVKDRKTVKERDDVDTFTWTIGY